MKMDWTQQPTETDKAFAAFVCFRELNGGDRTIVAVAAKVSKSIGLMRRWAKRWQWRQRVKALEAHMAEQERVAMNAEARKTAEELVKRRMQAVERDLATADRGNRAANMLLDKVEQLMKLPVVKQVKREETVDPATGAVVAVQITEIHPVHGDPASWLGTATRVLETTSKLQRLATGMHTEKTEINATVATTVTKFIGLKVDPKKVTG